jgi:hypothetical protein
MMAALVRVGRQNIDLGADRKYQDASFWGCRAAKLKIVRISSSQKRTGPNLRRIAVVELEPVDSAENRC